MFLDRFGERYMYFWVAAFSALGLAMTFILYHGWKERGGDDNYVPPQIPSMLSDEDARLL